jgi:L-arabinokinase
MPQPEPFSTDPAPVLLARLREELRADFGPGRPVRVSRAPGRLDVMGGIADYTGSLVCEMPLDRAAAVALQERDDRQVQIFSFNLYDEHKPFTFRVPFESLIRQPAEALRREFAEPGRKWAAYIAGCVFALHSNRFIDLANPAIHGLSFALYSTVPMGAGVSASAAIEVATMINLVDHFGLRDRLDGMKIAELCQQVENHLVGVPCGIMDQVTSCLGEAGSLLRMVCQPHELQSPLRLPPNMRVLGINSGVKHNLGGPNYARTRCAAFMGHRIILEKMSELGADAGRELIGDPMRGYLANLDPDDYKAFFRPSVPRSMRGGDFLDRYGPTIDLVTSIEPEVDYAIQQATDHHVLEARRVRRFAEFLEQACQTEGATRGSALDRAGHLMYASHQSYTMDAMLGAPECDLLVQLVRRRERAGFYGAKITGGGSGGTVAVLASVSSHVDEALDEIMTEYARETGKKAEIFTGSSAGAWHTGTEFKSS